jgi:hypothetical protein
MFLVLELEPQSGEGLFYLRVWRVDKHRCVREFAAGGVLLAELVEVGGAVFGGFLDDAAEGLVVAADVVDLLDGVADDRGVAGVETFGRGEWLPSTRGRFEGRGVGRPREARGGGLIGVRPFFTREEHTRTQKKVLWKVPYSIEIHSLRRFVAFLAPFCYCDGVRRMLGVEINIKKE